MKRTRQQGFTLIEAAVAIAVVAILSGIIVPLVVKNLRDSQVARAKNDVQVIAAAVASQIKDTGRRPTAAGPGGSTAVGTQAWASGPATAALFPVNTAVTTNGNTFTNLFTNPGTLAAAQTLFFGAASGVTVSSEFAYKGPYLANDVAVKTDPWGYRYLVLGYDATGQAGNTPIYIVSAGPDGQVYGANFNSGAGPANGIWVNTGAIASASFDDIVVRVN